MEDRKEEYRLKKQAYKREKRRHVTLWKSLCLVFLCASILLTLVCSATWVFDHITAKVTKDRLWTLSRADGQAVYYSASYQTMEDWQAAEETLQQQISAEAMVLLRNAENTLPLAIDTVLRLEGGASELQEALQQAGFQVSEEGQSVIAVVRGDSEQSYLTSLAEARRAGQVQKLVLLIAADADPVLWQQLGADAMLYVPVWEESLIAKALVGQLNPMGSLTEAVTLEQIDNPESAYCAAVVAGEDVTYHQTVMYPVGWGLHYTTFSYSAPKLTEEKGVVTVTTDVTNSGTVAGKEILQVYAVDPQGKLSLAGFGKTDMLEPGATETVAVTMVTEDMEAGIYCLTVAANGHEAANHYLAFLGHTPESTENKMDSAGNPEMVIRWTYPGGAQSGVNLQQDRTNAPVMGANNGVKLIQLQGLSFDAPLWQQLLDQLSFLDMVSMVADGGLYLPAVASVNAPGCAIDGLEGIFPREENGPSIQIVPATTWNEALSYEYGKLLGDWYLARELYLIEQDGIDASGSAEAIVSAALQAGKIKGMAQCGVAVANAGESSPVFSSWQGEVSQMSICQDLNYLPVLAALIEKKADIDTLWALRDACHRNLYALVNSAAMNYIGADSQVTVKMPTVVVIAMVVSLLFWGGMVVFAVLWGKGRANWKNTQEYLDFKLRGIEPR